MVLDWIQPKSQATWAIPPPALPTVNGLDQKLAPGSEALAARVPPPALSWGRHPMLLSRMRTAVSVNDKSGAIHSACAVIASRVSITTLPPEFSAPDAWHVITLKPAYPPPVLVS